MAFLHDHILSIILFTPLAGMALLLFIPGENKQAIKWWANIVMFADFLVSLPLVFWFPSEAPDQQFKFIEDHEWIASIGAHYHLGIDGISFLLIMLTTVLGFLSVLSSWSAIEERVKEYYAMFMLLQVGMLGVFMSLDFFLFYVFWEVMLVPMYFIIGVWGGSRKLYAAIKFFLYTLSGSVLMLLGILALYFHYHSATGVYTFNVLELMQRDMKKLIAYSSVSHLGFCTLGIFALNPHGLSGSILQQINHGISTGALFLVVGLIYERRHTREIKEFGGLSNVMPVYATLFMIVMLSSIGLPLLNGFIGELTLLQGAFEVHWRWPAWVVSGIGLGAAYMLWLYQRTMFGPCDNPKNQALKDLSFREVMTLVPLVVAAFWIGLYPKPFFNVLERPVTNIVERVNPGFFSAPVATSAAAKTPAPRVVVTAPASPPKCPPTVEQARGGTP